MAPEVWALALLATVLAAFVQGTVGVGYAVVAVPILALLDPSLAPVPQLLTALPLTLIMLWREHSEVDLHGVGWLIAGRLPGAALGVGLLAIATQRTLDLIIGLMVLAGVVVLASGISVKRTPVTQFSAGMASGTTGLVASIGGPPTALLYSTAEAATIRATLAAVFSIGVSISIGMRYATGNAGIEDLKVAAVLLPAMLVGWLASTLLKDRVPKRGVRMGVLAVSAVAAVALVTRALFV